MVNFMKEVAKVKLLLPHTQTTLKNKKKLTLRNLFNFTQIFYMNCIMSTIALFSSILLSFHLSPY